MSLKSAKELTAVISRFAGRRIVVAGDLVADEFVYGDIARVSREAPVLILDACRTTSTPGGGGNSAANLAALGARVVPVGVVGKDDSGVRLVDELREIGCSTGSILALAAYETPTKSRILAGGVHTRRQQIVRIDRGARHGSLAPKARARLRSLLRRAVVRADGLLIADYGYGAAAPELVRGAIGPMLRSGAGVTVDSRHRLLGFPRVTACTPNLEEVEGVLEREAIEGSAAIERAGRDLLRLSGNRAALVTLGARGMWLFQKDRKTVKIRAYGSGDVADVTGAGDTVIATLTLALASGASMPQSALLANYAAGLVVQKAGTATITADELAEAVQEDG